MNEDGSHEVSPELTSFLGKVRPGVPVPLPSVSVVPLLLDEQGPDAELLEEGLGSGHTRVSEVSEGGSVNTVNVEHKGKRLLLLVDGEEITGAKQNRVVNASFLVLPGQAVDIPVSCVERGRWAYKSKEFTSSGRTLSSAARSRKLSRVATSVTTTGRYDADQGAVWDDVDRYLDRTQTSSSTAAYTDAAERRESSVEQWMDSVAPVEGQVGIAVVQGSKLVALDVFGSPDLYRRAWKKIARGVLVEVYDKRPGNGDPRAVVSAALAQASKTGVTRQPAPGCGETLHGAAGDYVVGAVAHEGKVYHAMVGASG